MRDLDRCVPECHEKEGLRSRNSILDAELNSRLAMAVASWAALKPIQTRSKSGEEDELEVLSSCLDACCVVDMTNV